MGQNREGGRKKAPLSGRELVKGQTKCDKCNKRIVMYKSEC